MSQSGKNQSPASANAENIPISHDAKAVPVPKEFAGKDWNSIVLSHRDAWSKQYPGIGFYVDPQYKDSSAVVIAYTDQSKDDVKKAVQFVKSLYNESIVDLLATTSPSLKSRPPNKRARSSSPAAAVEGTTQHVKKGRVVEKPPGKSKPPHVLLREEIRALKRECLASFITPALYQTIQESPVADASDQFTYVIPIHPQLYDWFLMADNETPKFLRHITQVARIEFLQIVSGLHGDASDQEMVTMSSSLKRKFISSLHGGQLKPRPGLERLPGRPTTKTDREVCKELQRPIVFPKGITVTDSIRTLYKRGSPFCYFVTVTGTLATVNRFLRGLQLLTDSIDPTTTTVEYIPILNRYRPFLTSHQFSQIQMISLYSTCMVKVLNLRTALRLGLSFTDIDNDVFRGVVKAIPASTVEAGSAANASTPSSQPTLPQSKQTPSAPSAPSAPSSQTDGQKIVQLQQKQSHLNDTKNDDEENSSDSYSLDDDDNSDDSDDNDEQSARRSNLRGPSTRQQSRQGHQQQQQQQQQQQLNDDPFSSIFKDKFIPILTPLSRRNRLSRLDLPFYIEMPDAFDTMVRTVITRGQRYLDLYHSTPKKLRDESHFEQNLPIFYIRLEGTVYHLTQAKRTLDRLMRLFDQGFPYSIFSALVDPHREYFTDTIHIPIDEYERVRIKDPQFIPTVQALGRMVHIRTRLFTNTVQLTVSCADSPGFIAIKSYIRNLLRETVGRFNRDKFLNYRAKGIADALRQVCTHEVNPPLSDVTQAEEDTTSVPSVTRTEEDWQTIDDAIHSLPPSFPKCGVNKTGRFYQYYAHYKQTYPPREAARYALFYALNRHLIRG